MGLTDCPHWDTKSQSLYFVDVTRMNIHKYSPDTKTLSGAFVGPHQVSFIIPIEGKTNQFVISQQKELTRIFWDGTDEGLVEIEILAEVENSLGTLKNRFNVGKCDPLGRLWAGKYLSLSNFLNEILGTISTVPEKPYPLVYPPKGTLYCLCPEKRIKGHLNNIRVSNGIAFDAYLRKMYHIDSGNGAVNQYDFDLDKGAIGIFFFKFPKKLILAISANRKPVFTLAKHHLVGSLDGMTIDEDENLWIAIFNSGQIIQIDPRRSETLLKIIEMPVKQVIYIPVL